MILYIASVALVITGLYALLGRKNLLKKVMGFAVMINGVHLLLISLSYMSGAVAPIMQGPELSDFVASAADPLPQVLVLTSIVINLSTMALSVALITRHYQEAKTLDSNEMRSLRE